MILDKLATSLLPPGTMLNFEQNGKNQSSAVHRCQDTKGASERGTDLYLEITGLLSGLRSRGLEVMGTGKNGARERDMGPFGQALPLTACVSLACHVRSCARYFQASTAQAKT